MSEAIDKAWETQNLVTATRPGTELTKGERRWAGVLRVAPWLAFFVVALPLPLLFFVFSFVLADPTFWALMAVMGLAVGAVAGLLATIFLLLYRKRWMQRIRQKLSADGIKASELDWFLHELTGPERQALKAMSPQDPLLADAYRETLAMRLTATHVVTRAKRDLRSVEQRLNKLAYVKEGDSAQLRAELSHDKTRFADILRAGEEHLGQAKIRLQTIEAAAQRGANWSETTRALGRLSVSSAQVPLALELARIEEESRRLVEEETSRQL